MNVRKGLSTFAIVGCLTAAVASLGAAYDPYASPVPYGDALAQADSTAAGMRSWPEDDSTVNGLEARFISDPDMTAPGVAMEQRQILEGQVAAVDESGSLMLRTDDGLIALQLAPEDVRGVGVGDVMQVALLEIE